MTPGSIALFLVVLFAVAAVLTGTVRRYALANRLLDLPNARSSHSVATPRGGGLAIVIATVAGFVVLAFTGTLALPLAWALLGSGVAVAWIGFLDDHGHVAARWRLLVHFLVAAWALYWLQGPPELTMMGVPFRQGWVTGVLAAVYLVWMLNLYNFMDGIDGLAGAEAVTVCIGGALLYFAAGNRELAPVPLVVAAATSGFLCWNLPPARIFMGDAGSGFLGIVFGVLSLYAGRVDPLLFWSWVILLGVFVVDSSVTLLARLLRGERVYEAHRSHAYQRAARRIGSHRSVTLAAAAINVLWLLPISILVAVGRLGEVWGLSLAYVPLVLLALALGAGRVEETAG